MKKYKLTFVIEKIISLNPKRFIKGGIKKQLEEWKKKGWKVEELI